MMSERNIAGHHNKLDKNILPLRTMEICHSHLCTQMPQEMQVINLSSELDEQSVLSEELGRLMRTL